MPGAPVCKSRSGRKCVTAACRPHRKLKRGSTYKSESVADKKSIVEENESSVNTLEKEGQYKAGKSEQAKHSQSRKPRKLRKSRKPKTKSRRAEIAKEEKEEKPKSSNDKLLQTPSTSTPTAPKKINNSKRRKPQKLKKVVFVETNKQNNQQMAASKVIVTPRRFKLPASCDHYDKHDANNRFYSKYLTQYEISRIAYATHRLLHNYAMFRCDDPRRAQGLLNEELLQNITKGIEAFFINAYMYDPWYQPISFKKKFNYLEMHIKIGIGDKFVKDGSPRMFLKVFLIIFYKGEARFVLTKCREPRNINDKIYQDALNNNCQDIWCRADFITTCVNPQYRKVSTNEVNKIYNTLIDEESAIRKQAGSGLDQWTCVDFDTPAEDWGKGTTQFTNVIKKESTPYKDKNLLVVPQQEHELTPEWNRKRKIQNK